MKKISVLLVDDHTVVRQGLCALVSAEGDMEIAGEAENGRQAVQLAKESHPDVVLMDVAMPLMNGLEILRMRLTRDHKVDVIVGKPKVAYKETITKTAAGAPCQTRGSWCFRPMAMTRPSKK